MASPKVQVGAVVPPKITRGKRGTQIPKEVIDAFATGLATVGEDDSPSWISDQVPYDSRAKANAAASKIRKALAEDDDTRYTDTKMIQSRVWNTGEVKEDGTEAGPFYFALAEKPAEQ
jgi:hypothetical protein